MCYFEAGDIVHVLVVENGWPLGGILEVKSNKREREREWFWNSSPRSWNVPSTRLFFWRLLDSTRGEQLNIVDLDVLSRLWAISLLLRHPWGRTQWRKQNKCDCEHDMWVMSGKATSSMGGLWLHISRLHTHDPLLAFVAFFFAFFPTDFQVKERLLTACVLNQEVCLAHASELFLNWLDCDEPFWMDWGTMYHSSFSFVTQLSLNAVGFKHMWHFPYVHTLDLKFNLSIIIWVVASSFNLVQSTSSYQLKVKYGIIFWLFYVHCTCIVASKSLCSVEHTFTKLSNGVFHLEISGEVAAKKLIYTSWLAVWSWKRDTLYWNLAASRVKYSMVF